MSKLKPCANCGDMYPDLFQTGAGYQIWCSSCDMQTASDDWTKDAVIKIWNNRPNEWISVDGYKNMPHGTWVVECEEGVESSTVFHIAHIRNKLSVIGGSFAFDQGRVIRYKPV